MFVGQPVCHTQAVLYPETGQEERKGVVRTGGQDQAERVGVSLWEKGHSENQASKGKLSDGLWKKKKQTKKPTSKIQAREFTIPFHYL